MAPAAEPWEASGRRHLRVRPVGIALTALGGLSGALWLVSHQKPQLAVAAAIAFALVIDGIVVWMALGAVTVEVLGDGDLVAGQPTTWILAVDGVRRPISVGPAVAGRRDWVRVESDAPGRISLPGLSRGVVRSLLFDVTAVGPAGLFESGRRYRVRLADGLSVGPPSLPQRVAWPRPRAVGFGQAESTPIGDDLFRSIRPYVRGDSRRRMHWKATAHHGRMMISETDGTGVVALRIIVPLPPRGPVADVIAGRAAAIAEQALGRGWLVHLVTRAPEYLPPEPVVPLGSPFGMPPPLPPPIPVPDHTVDRRVTNRAAIRRELALASAGQPSVPAWSGLTCIVGAESEEWR